MFLIILCWKCWSSQPFRDVPVSLALSSQQLLPTTGNSNCWDLEQRLDVCSPVRCHSNKDLHSHGEAGHLGYDVSQGAGWCLQGQQVGNSVDHPAQEEHLEVGPGYQQGWLSHGINRTQEQEGEYVLHVVVVGPATETQA